MAAIVRVGPWGGEGGNPWDDGVHSGIHIIKVCFDGVAINSIQIRYDNDGNFFWSEEHGENARNNGEEVQFDCPRENLTLISGFHDIYIRTLACESNYDRYGPYGIQRENNFESPRGRWKIVGFHGRSDGYLRSIGVYLSNLNVEGCFPPMCPFSGTEPEPILVGSSFPGLKLISVGPSGGDGGDSSHALKLISVGPWGGDGGDTWDDVLYSGIHKIRVGYDRCAIVSIHIEYDNNGSTFWKEHGRSHYDEEIELDYPQEILTSISGYYDTYLKSLTFESNFKKKYGPYGSEEGTCFSFPISDGEIVSFYGRSDEYLRSIGAHLRNLHAAVPPLESPREGEAALIVGESLSGSARQARRAGKKEEEKAERKKEEGSRASEEEEGSNASEEEEGGSSASEEEEDTRALREEEEGGGGSRAREEEEERKEEKEAAVPPQCLKVGPWGLGEGGVFWDDGAYSGIRGIRVLFDDHAICSIGIEYDHHGSSVLLGHGNNTGQQRQIQLDYPREILTSISGSYGPYGIRRLTFNSNLRRYGPYGIQGGGTHDFSFPNEHVKIVKIVGFHGRSDEYLRSIGVYYLPANILGVGVGYRNEDAFVGGGSSSGSAKKATEKEAKGSASSVHF